MLPACCLSPAYADVSELASFTRDCSRELSWARRSANSRCLWSNVALFSAQIALRRLNSGSRNSPVQNSLASAISDFSCASWLASAAYSDAIDFFKFKFFRKCYVIFVCIFL